MITPTAVEIDDIFYTAMNSSARDEIKVVITHIIGWRFPNFEYLAMELLGRDLQDMVEDTTLEFVADQTVKGRISIITNGL